MISAQNIKQVRVELEWTAPVSDIPADNYDLDACAFLLDRSGKLPRDEFFVFYNNLRSPADAVVLKADDIDGGDGEVMLINLEKVPEEVERILFLVTIYNAEERMQSFDNVADASISIYDRTDGKLILRSPLGNVAPGSTAVEFGEIIRNVPGDWAFHPLAKGSRAVLADFVAKYSVNN